LATIPRVALSPRYDPRCDPDRALPLTRQATMTKLLRWTFVPLSGIAVWYAALLLGIAGYGLLDRLCPPALVVSGACTASWHGPASEALLLLCTALASAGIVLVPALVAPARRFRVSAAARHSRSTQRVAARCGVRSSLQASPAPRASGWPPPGGGPARFLHNKTPSPPSRGAFRRTFDSVWHRNAGASGRHQRRTGR
jgi:hypothetical protein